MYVLLLKILKKLPEPIQNLLREINFTFFGLFRNISYSQIGEDLVISNLLPNKGFYIDIGAHHPKIISNTYKLYKSGRKGINIDPLPGTKKLFDKYRRNDINLEIGIGKNQSVLEYYIFNVSTNNTFDKAYAEDQIAKGLHLIEKKMIHVYPLSYICEKYNVKQIDFLTIDVEGFDLDILKSIDWSRNKPKVIAIEIHNLDFDNIKYNPIYKFLRDEGYKLNSYLIMTAIFIYKN